MGWIRVDCKSHKSFIYNGPPDLYKPERPRLAQGPRPPPSKQPAAVSNARGRGGCRVSLGPGAGGRERGQRVGAGPASPSPRAAARHDPGPDPPPAGSRRARSRVAAAADGHRPIVHLQADGTAELCLQAAVAARGPGWRLPLLCRGHQAAEHRHPPARPPPLPPIQAGRPASLPRRRRTGVTARPASVFASRLCRLCANVILARRLFTTADQPTISMCQAGEDYEVSAQREPLPVPRPG